MMRRFLAILALGAALGSAPVLAQDAPDPVRGFHPTAEALHEDQLLDALGPRDTISGRITIPDQRAADLEKPGNKDWTWANRAVMDRVLIAAVVLTLLATVIFYVIVGRQRMDKGPSGRKILRFALFERVVHWTMASSFIVLALSGLNIAIGRFIVLPWLGEATFGKVTLLGKLAHNYLAWPFMLTVILTFFMWIGHNIPSRLDIEWFKAGGGLLKNGKHPAARKFNAGQKLVFWVVILGGSLAAVSGLALLFPYVLGAPWQWQAAQMLHVLAASGMIAMVIGHIYIGTIGSEGALQAMTTGEVDVNWAEQHHSLWLHEQVGKGAVHGGATPPAATPAE